MQHSFACPVHKILLTNELYCDVCEKAYPQRNGIPILLDESKSVFRTEAFLLEGESYGGASSYGGSLDSVRGVRKYYRKLIGLLTEESRIARRFSVEDAMDYISTLLPNPYVLVIGAGDTKLQGRAVHLDVAFGKNVECIADAHDLPFEDNTFDVCIIVAVLEHVAFPWECVEEIRRVLRPRGVVYSETPFLQPVHMGAHDFTRFTHLGHRLLFRAFDEIKSGPIGGPGLYLSLALRQALLAIPRGRRTRSVARLLGLIFTYPLRYVDLCLPRNDSSYDAAAGYFFLGRLREEVVSTSVILTEYRGVQQ